MSVSSFTARRAFQPGDPQHSITDHFNQNNAFMIPTAKVARDRAAAHDISDIGVAEFDTSIGQHYDKSDLLNRHS